MTEDTIIENRNILIKNSIISKIRKKAIRHPPNSTRTDGTGRYLVPGLIDSHVHIDFQWDLFSYDSEIFNELLGSKRIKPVTAVFLCHLVNPIEVPILDQHVFRAWLFLTRGEKKRFYQTPKQLIKSIPGEVPEKFTVDVRKYLEDLNTWQKTYWKNTDVNEPGKSVANTLESIGIENFRLIDRGLWRFGSYLLDLKNSLKLLDIPQVARMLGLTDTLMLDFTAFTQKQS